MRFMHYQMLEYLPRAIFYHFGVFGVPKGKNNQQEYYSAS